MAEGSEFASVETDLPGAGTQAQVRVTDSPSKYHLIIANCFLPDAQTTPGAQAGVP